METMDKQVLKKTYKFRLYPNRGQAAEVEFGNYINLPYFGNTRTILTVDQKPVPLDYFLEHVRKNTPEKLDEPRKQRSYGNGGGAKLDQLFQEILSRLKDVMGPDFRGNYQAICPLHDDHHRSLSLHPTKGIHCFAPSCKAYKGISRKDLAKEIGLVISREPIRKKLKLIATEAMEKLKAERCLSDETIAHFGITVDEARQAWSYPAKGGYRYKAFDSKSKRKYWHDKGVPNQLYGIDDIPQGTEKIWWVDGEPAVWLMWQAGMPTICGIYGEGKIPPDATLQLKAKGILRINYVADNDKAGETAAKLIWAALHDEFEAIPKRLPSYLGKGADVVDLCGRTQGAKDRFKQELENLENFDTSNWKYEASLAEFLKPDGGIDLSHVNLAEAIMSKYIIRTMNDNKEIYFYDNGVYRAKGEELVEAEAQKITRKVAEVASKSKNTVLKDLTSYKINETSNTGVWHYRAKKFNFYLRGFKYLFIMRKPEGKEKGEEEPRSIKWSFYVREDREDYK